MKKFIAALSCMFCLTPTLAHASNYYEGYYHFCADGIWWGKMDTVWLDDYQLYWYDICTFMVS